MKFFTKEVKIALVAIAGIIVLFFGLHFLKGMPIFSTNNVYYATFKDINGLSSSNPIYADGYQVGNVKNIIYDYQKKGRVLVEFQVDNDLRIPKGSSAEIVSDLMGNIKMNLLLANNSRERVEPGDTITGNLDAGLMGSVQQLVPTIAAMLPKVDSILASVNMLLADPAISASLHNIQTVSANLAVTSQGLNRLVAQANGQVPGILTKADYALGKAGATLNNTEKFTASLTQLNIDQTMAKVDRTLDNVESVTQQLNSPNGSLGLLMNDPALYHNLNSTIRSADSLLTNIKAHPKRYVHFSLFGKKDK
ncbi:MlaD family protein [Hallella multisaccharivorax]|uniref:MlaD family protein n=1 Tax=Hallella multisaccharivorax TaxID=310514 RepID=UPI0036123C09